jgi:hypothetical protein
MSGEIPSIKIGKSRRIPIAQLDAWVARQVREQLSGPWLGLQAGNPVDILRHQLIGGHTDDQAAERMARGSNRDNEDPLFAGTPATDGVLE